MTRVGLFAGIAVALFALFGGAPSRAAVASIGASADVASLADIETVAQKKFKGGGGGGKNANRGGGGNKNANRGGGGGNKNANRNNNNRNNNNNFKNNNNNRNKNVNVRVNVRPVRGWVRRPYYGTIVGGVALGAVIAASAVPVAPAAGLCWYWTDATQSNGYWDYCS